MKSVHPWLKVLLPMNGNLNIEIPFDKYSCFMMKIPTYIMPDVYRNYFLSLRYKNSNPSNTSGIKSFNSQA